MKAIQLIFRRLRARLKPDRDATLIKREIVAARAKHAATANLRAALRELRIRQLGGGL